MQEQETRSKRAQLIQAMQLLKPNPTSLAYALFVASNATIIWGGSFPFLPLTFQTKAMTTSFFLAQALAFSACFAAVLVSLLLRKPGNVVRKYRLTLIPAAPYLLGWACLIAAMYIPQGSRALGIAGGAFTGFGAAGLMLVWVRLFCAKPRRYGAGLITQSLLYAPIIYWLLTAIPTAIAVFLMPSVVTPLILLALMLESRDTEFTGPMFQRVPPEPVCALEPGGPPVKRRSLLLPLAVCYNGDAGGAQRAAGCDGAGRIQLGARRDAARHFGASRSGGGAVLFGGRDSFGRERVRRLQVLHYRGADARRAGLYSTDGRAAGAGPLHLSMYHRRAGYAHEHHD